MEAPQIQIDTTMGSFTVELYYRHAPKASKNFEGLAKKGYYDGVVVGCVTGAHVHGQQCAQKLCIYGQQSTQLKHSYLFSFDLVYVRFLAHAL